jgi:hypothetical protein
MGIRVHKVLGYGLTDLKVGQDFRIDDPRVNPQGILHADWNENGKRWSKGIYRDWLVKKKGEYGSDRFTIEMEEAGCVQEGWRPQQSFVHDAEQGMGNILCVIPAAYYHEWRRYDDAIDYYDEQNHWQHKGQGGRVVDIKGGIYPWIGVGAPACIRLLCEFGEAFTDISVVNQLLPMLYVYWS